MMRIVDEAGRVFWIKPEGILMVSDSEVEMIDQDQQRFKCVAVTSLTGDVTILAIKTEKFIEALKHDTYQRMGSTSRH